MASSGQQSSWQCVNVPEQRYNRKLKQKLAMSVSHLRQQNSWISTLNVFHTESLDLSYLTFDLFSPSYQDMTHSWPSQQPPGGGGTGRFLYSDSKVSIRDMITNSAQEDPHLLTWQHGVCVTTYWVNHILYLLAAGWKTPQLSAQAR